MNWQLARVVISVRWLTSGGHAARALPLGLGDLAHSGRVHVVVALAGNHWAARAGLASLAARREMRRDRVCLPLERKNRQSIAKDGLDRQKP